MNSKYTVNMRDNIIHIFCMLEKYTFGKINHADAEQEL